VQKLIAKYGTAAHLAMLAVAPLFLFPFVGEAQVATVLLWLSLPAFCWMMLEPSVLRGETLRVARVRVVRAMGADPLFWVSLVLTVLLGVQALNDGVSLVYDAESAKWILSPSAQPFLPGCVQGAGRLPFAGAVAATILMQGCRHALGRSARMAFLLVASSLAGTAAVLAVLLGVDGNSVVRGAINCPVTASFPVGVAFYLHLLGGTVALVAAFERMWNLTMPLFAFAIGGTAAAAFLFSPVVVTLVFASAEVLLLVYSFFYSARTLVGAGGFKFLVVLVVSWALGALLVMALEPSAAMQRVSAFGIPEFLPASFVSVRDALSGVAIRSWLQNLWLGTGLASFPLAFRFSATPADWLVVRAGAEAVPNGWLLLLAERGIVGIVAVCLPFGFLLFTYVRRLIGWVGAWELPEPACWLGPLVLAALAVAGLFCCATQRTDVMVAALSLLAVSANSFPRTKGVEHG